MLAWLGFWSNHFGNSFHFDDFPTIVNNPWLAHTSNIGRFFTNPRTFSAAKETADYRPLLSTLFALDYSLGGGAKAFIFQASNFLWFTLQLLAIYALFRLIPGGNHYAALFGTFLYGLHPVTADTVNYPLQRGTIIGSLGVIAGLVLWIYWPRRLPQTLPIKLKRVPEHGFDEFLRNNYKTLEARYLQLIHLPVGLYLWPVILALLVDPAAAVFAPILLAYILTFETERHPRQAILATVLCVGYWIFQTVLVWPLGAFSRIPAANYWITQPWIVMRYLYTFFVPAHLSADTDFVPFAHFWSPLALAGFAGLAALIAFTVWLSRQEDWRAVAFGLWWFLIALVPNAVVPHRVVEADWWMYLPFVGLAFAVSRAAWIAFALLYGSSRLRNVGLFGIPIAAVVVLAACGWVTYGRNAAWETESSLWSDVIAKSPHNGRAFMYLGLTRINDDYDIVLYNLNRAHQVSPHDALIEINLARALNTLSRPAESDPLYRSAIADAPSYSPAYSSYSQYLQSRQRVEEGYAMARKALSLDPYDLVARRIVMAVLADRHGWIDLRQVANDTLRLYPGDPDGARALVVAQTGIDHVAEVEKAALQQPSPDNYLNLSVQYFNTQRYDDAIRACQDALKINPNLPEAYSNMAAAYHAEGKLDETVAALEQAIKLNPDLPSAAHNLKVAMSEKARMRK